MTTHFFVYVLNLRHPRDGDGKKKKKVDGGQFYYHEVILRYYLRHGGGVHFLRVLKSGDRVWEIVGHTSQSTHHFLENAHHFLENAHHFWGKRGAVKLFSHPSVLFPRQKQEGLRVSIFWMRWTCAHRNRHVHHALRVFWEYLSQNA